MQDCLRSKPDQHSGNVTENKPMKIRSFFRVETEERSLTLTLEALFAETPAKEATQRVRWQR